jgi:hypothetical protein
MKVDLSLVAIAPHTLLALSDGLWLHRKATAVAEEKPIPLAGSRNRFNYLLSPSGAAATPFRSLARTRRTASPVPTHLHTQQGIRCHFALHAGARCLRFDIFDLPRGEDQRRANQSLRQSPVFESHIRFQSLWALILRNDNAVLWKGPGASVAVTWPVIESRRPSARSRGICCNSPVHPPLARRCKASPHRCRTGHGPGLQSNG